jgi:hypothetical protein
MSALPLKADGIQQLGSFRNTCGGGRYFSPRLRCRFNLAVRAISIRRRIASEREGLSFCCLAQFSIADRVLGGRRRVRTGLRPVPADAQHLRFAQSSALGRKASDEFHQRPRMGGPKR